MYSFNVRIIHSPAKPMMNGHASLSSPVIPHTPKTKKIRKEEFVLFPGYRGREESMEDGEKSSPSKPPYTAMIREALLGTGNYFLKLNSSYSPVPVI